MGDVDYSGGAFYSANDSDQNYPTGWLLENEFLSAVSSGAISVFVPGDQFDEASRDALDDAVYSGNWGNTKVAVTGFDFKASLPIFELPAGEAYMAAGLDWRTTSYQYTISKANRDELILFLSTGQSYDLARDNWGAFTEFAVPVLEGFDVTASVLFDSIGKIDDKLQGGSKGSEESEMPYKISGRYQATDNLLIRASVSRLPPCYKLRVLGMSLV